MISPAIKENIRKYFPQIIKVYTDSGSFEFTQSDITREPDIIRAAYNGSTYEKTGNPLSDGQPDFVVFDIHFHMDGDKLKTVVNISHGDAMKAGFSLEEPNVVDIGHYEGIGSKSSQETHFGFEDDTLEELIETFNSFNKNYRFTREQFKFLDKYPDSYKHNEKVNLMPLSKSEAILLIDNSKPPEYRFINNLKEYLQSRGIHYVKVSNLDDAFESIKNHKIIGILMSGSEYNIDKSPDKQKLFKWAIKNFTCPTIAICYAAQSMMYHYGAKVYRGKLLHDNLKFTEYKEHPLLYGIDCSKYQFSFSFRDYITKAPEGFEEIAKLDKRVVFAANDTKKEYALFFHPENIEFTHLVLDNFMRMIHPAQDEQDRILGISESRVLTFSEFMQ